MPRAGETHPQTTLMLTMGVEGWGNDTESATEEGVGESRGGKGRLGPKVFEDASDLSGRAARAVQVKGTAGAKVQRKVREG